MKKIELYRKKIDKIDNQLIEILKKRFDIVKKIGVIKKKFSLPSLDKKRWQIVLQSRIKKGEKLGLRKSFVLKIYQLIHKEALKIQEELKNDKL